MAYTPDSAERPFSITEGGPYHRATRRLHLLRPSGMMRAGTVVAIAWVPLMIGAGLRMIAGMRPDPLIYDISVHTRFLVGLPLLVVAERLLEAACRSAAHQLYAAPLVDRTVLARLVARAERMRDSVWVEAALALTALTLGQLVLWGVLPATGVVAGVSERHWTISRVWYAAVALPLVQFTIGRWLWRWLIWTYMLVKLSRLPIATRGTHPDHAAGLEFLSWPLTGFAGFVLANASILSGAWATQLIAGKLTFPALLPTTVLLLLVAYVLACGPLLLFTPAVFRARRRALAEYSPFALDYTKRFQQKWIQGKPIEPLLGTPDIQSLNDLMGAFEHIQQTRMFVFSPRRLRDIFLATLVPMLPLVATLVPLEHVLKRVAGAVLGVAL